MVILHLRIVYEQYKKVLEIDPKYMNANQYLSNILVYKNRKYIR